MPNRNMCGVDDYERQYYSQMYQGYPSMHYHGPYYQHGHHHGHHYDGYHHHHHHGHHHGYYPVGYHYGGWGSPMYTGGQWQTGFPMYGSGYGQY